MPRTKGSKNIPWDEIVAQLRRHPDRWQVLPQMRATTPRTVQVIQKRERRALRMDDGRIHIRRRATAYLDDGEVRITLALKFVPRPPKKEAPDAP